MKKMKVVAVIPAKNEEKGIETVLKGIPPVISNVLVVDGSSDKTVQIAKAMGAEVVKETRPGYGRAYKTGFENLPSDTDIVVCLDADGTYSVGRIPELIELLNREEFDFISCARNYGKVMSTKHKVGNFVLSFFTNLLFGVGIKDSQTGMWVFRKSVLEGITMKSDGMAFSEELKIRVIKNGFKFREITVDYGKRIGEEKLNSFSDGFSNLFYLFKLRVKLWKKRFFH